MKILVVNGPNLNLTGRRSTDIYGTETLDDIIKALEEYLNRNGAELVSFQSNHEGALIDRIQLAMDEVDGLIINPGAYTHYSYAIRDAIEATALPAVEVHLSDIHAREPFRAVSVIEPVCIAQVSALGKQSYIEGARLLLARLGSK